MWGLVKLGLYFMRQAWKGAQGALPDQGSALKFAVKGKVGWEKFHSPAWKFLNAMPFARN